MTRRTRLPAAIALAILAHAACSQTGGTAPPAPPEDDASPADDAGADAPAEDAAIDAGRDDGGPGVPPGASVLQRHKNATRDGHYVDAALTRAAVHALHADPAFTPTPLRGPVYAQPLYVENGVGGNGTLYVATMQDWVYAVDVASGAVLWQKQVATPVAQRMFDCANIDPIGILGTPIVDMGSRTIFLDAMHSDDGGTTKRHLLFALSLDDGVVRHGYPVDLAAKLAAQGVSFDPAYQQQRGALALMKNRLYVPFGAYAGDCGNYHGFVLGIPIENPAQVYSWSVKGGGGGIWGPGGPANDDQALYVATGNTDTTVPSWSGGDAIIKLGPGPAFSGQPSDWFAPSNWRDLDQADLELGGSQPILVDMPGAAHPKIAVGLAKNGNVYVVDRGNLGGLGTGNGMTGEGLASAHVASDYIINAGAAYTTAAGTFVAFKAPGIGCPTGSTLVAVKIATGDPPLPQMAWCAAPDAGGSPIASTIDGHSEAIVWTLGADGNTRVMAYDGETGATIFDGGPDTFEPVARYQSPILVKGRAIWASNEALHAFTVK